MTKHIIFILGIFFCVFSHISYAQDVVVIDENSNIETVDKIQDATEPLAAPSPEVGKHVMANMDASSMVLSLLMVLALIIICALVLKRFNLTQQNSSQLNVVASLSLGAKERVIVVQIGEEQLVLGVCSQQISLLKNLDKPLDVQPAKSLALSGNVLSFLQKSNLGKSVKTSTKTATTKQ